MKALKGFLLNSKVILSLVGATAIVATTAVIVFNDGAKVKEDITSIMERYMSDFALEYNDQDIVLVSTLKAAGYEIEIDTNCFNDSYIQINVDEDGKYSFELIKVCDVNDVTFKLNGDAKVKVEFGSTYVEQGATATVDGHDVSSAIKITDNIDYDKLGTYTVTYSVVRNGKESTTTRSVEIVDTTAPSILLKNSYVMSVVLGDKFVEPGYRAVDKYDGDLTKNVLVEGNVDTKKLGTYIITYSVSDGKGNLQTVKRTVNVVEAVSPVITLKGFGKVNIEYRSVYKDSGFEAIDKQNGNITNKVITTVYNEAGNAISAIDTETLGTYTIVYKVTNTYGKSAEVKRTVVVENTRAPKLDIFSETNVTIETCKNNADGTLNNSCTFTYPIVTATDIYKDKNITSDVKRVGSVDMTTVGTYTLTYSVISPSNGLVTTKTVTVNVVDKTKPVITLNGEAEITIEAGDSYTDAGAYVIDNYDEKKNISYSTSNPIFSADAVGDYELIYTTTDSNGNVADVVKRIVHVVDTQKPVITIAEGYETIKIYNDAKYNVMDRVTAFDTYDKNLTASTIYEIVAQDELNNTAIEAVPNEDNTYIFNNPGTYVVSYNVTDSSGNVADTQIKTIIVYDMNEPIIIVDTEDYTLDENGNIIVEAGHLFTIPSYTVIDNLGGLTEAVVTILDPTGANINEINTKELGTYTIYYLIDNDRKQEEVIITVIVQDELPTEITFDTQFVFEAGQFIDIFNGIHVSDNLDGVLSSQEIKDAIINGKLKAVGKDDEGNELNPDRPKKGTYAVSYTYINSNGKVTTKESARTIIINDSELQDKKLAVKTELDNLFQSLYVNREDYGVNFEIILGVYEKALIDLNCADLFTEVETIKLNAINAMRAVNPLDKVELKAIVTQIAGLNSEDYVEETWNEFIDAKELADAMEENTQDKVDAKLAAYENALTKLVMKISVAKTNKFNEIKSEYDQSLYTEISWDAFLDKLNFEISRLATLTEVADYNGETAIALLEKKPEVILAETKTAKINKILTIDYIEADYTEATWSIFKTTIESAISALTTVEEVNDYDATTAAADLLTHLEQAKLDKINKILTIDYIEADYTEATWSVFKTTVESAISALTTVEEVNDYDATTVAASLVTKLTQAKLDKITEILTVEYTEADYTESSWLAFETAIEDGINALNSITAVESFDYESIALDLLEKLADVILAEAKTAKINSILDSYKLTKNNYTKASWNLFETAVKAIVNSFVETTAVESYVLTTEVNILNKTEEVKLIEAKEAKLISVLASYIAERDKYSDDSWNIFVGLVEEAIEDLDTIAAVNEYVITTEDDGLSDSEAAALAKDKQLKISDVLNNYTESNYTEESWNAFVTLITAAINELTIDSIESYTVSEEIEKTLIETDAVQLAAAKADKITEVLNPFVVNKNLYTEASWNLFESVVKALINSFDNEVAVNNYEITTEANILAKADVMEFVKPSEITTVENTELPTYINENYGLVENYEPTTDGVDFTYKVGDMVGTKNVRAEIEVTRKNADTNEDEVTTDLFILAQEDNNGPWWNLVISGWGNPETGFPISAGYTATTKVYFVTAVADTYTITFRFVDMDGKEVMKLTDSITISNPGSESAEGAELQLTDFTTESVETYKEALESGDEDAIIVAKANLEFAEPAEIA